MEATGIFQPQSAPRIPALGVDTDTPPEVNGLFSLRRSCWLSMKDRVEFSEFELYCILMCGRQTTATCVRATSSQQQRGKPMSNPSPTLPSIPLTSSREGIRNDGGTSGILDIVSLR